MRQDFIVYPGINPATIRFRFRGAGHVTAADDGSLMITGPLAELQLTRPRVYQDIDGVRVEHRGRFVVDGDGVCGFYVEEFSPEAALVIDPICGMSPTWAGRRASCALGSPSMLMGMCSW